MSIVPVLISGGSGSRLWPVSRALRPKPFMRLPDGQSLIALTCRRAMGIEGVRRVVTVTNRELAFQTSDEYAALPEAVEHSFILEPFGRDTAAAVALAALHLAATDSPERILLVLPTDHLLTDDAGFRSAVRAAAALAGEGRIVTFGIRASRPETGFGYIEAEGSRVVRFVEKPDAATAAEYVASGRFFWNSGMFCFAAGTMVEAMRAHCPEVLGAARTALAQAKRTRLAGHRAIHIEERSFAAVPAISIDYAVMEKARNVGFVPGDFGWSDIGSWNAISELVPPDEGGNRVIGEALLHEARDCFVRGESRLVSLIGVSDLLVVDTADALLVGHKAKAQEVKAIYNRLKSDGHEAALAHRTVHRPWGTYTVLEQGDRFKIKRIEVNPGARLSLQAHRHRSEHWVVVSGTAKVVNGNRELVLASDQSTYIPRGHRHRVENPGVARLVMIEVQSGDYVGEDDIVRFEDVYGRA